MAPRDEKKGKDRPMRYIESWDGVRSYSSCSMRMDITLRPFLTNGRVAIVAAIRTSWKSGDIIHDHDELYICKSFNIVFESFNH
jgi:hypothetical protein